MGSLASETSPRSPCCCGTKAKQLLGSCPFLSFLGERGPHMLCGFEGCMGTQQGSQDARTGAVVQKHLIVLPSQSHKYKPASLSPPQPLLNVFTRAPLSVPLCYYKALIFDAWAIQKGIHLPLPPTLLSSHREELINRPTPPKNPDEGSPCYKTWRDHTVTLCNAVQEEKTKWEFDFLKQKTHSAQACSWLPVAATVPADRGRRAAHGGISQLAQLR